MCKFSRKHYQKKGQHIVHNYSLYLINRQWLIAWHPHSDLIFTFSYGSQNFYLSYIAVTNSLQSKILFACYDSFKNYNVKYLAQFI